MRRKEATWGELGRSTLLVLLLSVATGSACGADGEDETSDTTVDANTSAVSETTLPADTSAASETTEVPETSELPQTTAGEAGDGFVMPPADGWTTLDTVGAADLAFGAPGGPIDGFLDNVNVLIQPDIASDLDGYRELSLAGTEQLAGYTAVTPISDTELGGEPAFSQEWEADLGPGGRRLHFWTVATLVDGDGYVWTYTARPESFDEHRAGAEQMLDAFELTPD